MSDTRQQLLDNVLAVVAELEGDLSEVYAEDGEEPTVLDWLQDQLSIESYTTSSRGEYLGAEVLVTCGGPDIRVHTRRSVVVGYWGSDRIERGYTDEIGLNEMLADHWECIK